MGFDDKAGCEACKGNTWRPAIVSECMQRANPNATLPESAHAPWLRAVGGHNAPKLNAAVQFAYLGVHEAAQAAAANRSHRGALHGVRRAMHLAQSGVENAAERAGRRCCEGHV